MRQLLETLQLQPDQTLASLGVGGGFWEVGLGAQVPGLTVYLVELSAELLNETELAASVAFWEKQTGRPVKSHFVPVVGAASDPNLPTRFFDKILILNSFHEFTEPEAMLAACRRALKPTGQLFVEERLAQHPGELHAGCGRPLFSETALVELVSLNGFALRQAVSRDRSAFWKIFEFVVS